MNDKMMKFIVDMQDRGYDYETACSHFCTIFATDKPPSKRAWANAKIIREQRDRQVLVHAVRGELTPIQVQQVEEVVSKAELALFYTRIIRGQSLPGFEDVATLEHAMVAARELRKMMAYDSPPAKAQDNAPREIGGVDEFIIEE